MTLTAFFDRLTHDIPETPDALRERIERAGVNEVRAETLRRLESGALPPLVATSVLALIDLKSVISDLRRLLHAESSSDQVRFASLLLLSKTQVDLGAELDGMAPEVAQELVVELDEHRERVVIAMQRGTPFEALAGADRDYPEDVESIVYELVETFLTSPECAELPDRDEAGWWVRQLVRYAFDYGLGSPVVLLAEDVEEILTELLPRKVTIASKENAVLAIPAFRAFFQWTNRVTETRDTERILAVLERLEPEFPSMMMDERRFGMAKSFISAGRAAGYDMETQESLDAFRSQWNRAQRQSLPASRNEDKSAEKRKKKMEKASRRKNRRRK